MNKELQLKATLLDLEKKLDKNSNPYFRLSLVGIPNRYFYAFSFSLPEATFASLTNTPHNFINRQLLITYQELSNRDGSGTFCKIKQIELT
jgi:hypothetical protein